MGLAVKRDTTGTMTSPAIMQNAPQLMGETRMAGKWAFRGEMSASMTTVEKRKLVQQAILVAPLQYSP